MHSPDACARHGLLAWPWSLNIRLCHLCVVQSTLHAGDRGVSAVGSRELPSRTDPRQSIEASRASFNLLWATHQ